MQPGAKLLSNNFHYYQGPANFSMCGAMFDPNAMPMFPYADMNCNIKQQQMMHVKDQPKHERSSKIPEIFEIYPVKKYTFTTKDLLERGKVVIQLMFNECKDIKTYVMNSYKTTRYNPFANERANEVTIVDKCILDIIDKFLNIETQDVAELKSRFKPKAFSSLIAKAV